MRRGASGAPHRRGSRRIGRRACCGCAVRSQPCFRAVPRAALRVTSSRHRDDVGVVPDLGRLVAWTARSFSETALLLHVGSIHGRSPGRGSKRDSSPRTEDPRPRGGAGPKRVRSRARKSRFAMTSVGKSELDGFARCASAGREPSEGARNTQGRGARASPPDFSHLSQSDRPINPGKTPEKVVRKRPLVACGDPSKPR